MSAVALPMPRSRTLRPAIRLDVIPDFSPFGSALRNPLEVTFRVPPPVLNTQHSTSVLVGREAELAHLHGLFAQALHGKRQVVFLTGEAGIGKTTLVDSFLAQLRYRRDIRIAVGQCVEQYGPGEAYMPLLEATTQLCRGPGREQRIEGLKRYAPTWLAQLPGLLEPSACEQLQQRTQGTSRERMLREMAEAAELFTTTRALVLVIEDLHWSDVSTLDWVSYMARRREPAKLLILGTYRPADALASNHPLHGTVRDLQAREQCQELRLAPLAEEAIGEYLTVRLKADVGRPCPQPLQQLTPLLHHRTGGNPLFMVNTVDDLIRQGVLTEDAGRWTLRADTAETLRESVPDSLRHLIDRQIERLPEPEQRLLEVASVAGVEFAAAEVAAGLSINSEAVEAQCERWARAGQWVRETGVAEWPDGTLSGRYSFRHALYPEVVYARIAEARRLQLHRRIANRKEAAYGERTREIAAELAVHCEKGRELTRAVHYLGKAGENAIQRCAHREATSLLTKGLDLLTTLPQSPACARQELQLRLALVESLIATKGYGALEVERACARARELCQQEGEPHQLLLALWGLSGFYLTRAELPTTRELGEQLLRLAHSAQEPILLQAAHLALGQPLFHCGELVLARTHLEQSTVFYDRRTHGAPAVRSMRDPGVASLCYEAWALWLLGYAEQALKRIHDACSLAQELARPLELAWVLNYAAGLHYFCREPQAVREQAEAAIRISTEQGFPFWVAMGTLMQGWALAMQGQAEDGIAQMRQGLVAWRAMGAGVGQPGFLAMLAEAQGEAGQVEDGLDTLAEAVALVTKTSERYSEAELYRLRGELTLQAKGDNPRSAIRNPQWAEAEACFLQALDIARRQEAKSLELRAAMSLARLWQRQNKLDDARELLEDIYGWFTEGFDTKDLQDAAALLRELGSTEESQKSKGKSQKEQGARGWGLGVSPSSPQASSPKTLAPHTLSSASPTSDLQHPAPGTQHLTSAPQHLAPNTQHPSSNLLRPEGEYWTVSFAGVTCRLKEARGLHFLAHLLQHPHQEIHVISLIALGADLNTEPGEAPFYYDAGQPLDHIEGFSDAGEILDPQARAAYKQRLSELREELAKAEEFHDLGQSERLSAEIDYLTYELAGAVGLGGRARRMGSPAERARVNITRAIKIVLRRITEHHPALGQHLATTLKTGTYCSYTPDVRMPITWQG